MAKKFDEEMNLHVDDLGTTSTTDDDEIRPEDSASNVSFRTTTSIAEKRKKARQAARKLERIAEEAALSDQRRKIERERFERQARIERRRREAELEQERRRREAEQEQERLRREAEFREEEERSRLEDEARMASLEAEMKRLEAERDLREAEEEEAIMSIVSSSSRRTKSQTTVSTRRPRKHSTPIMRQPTSFLVGVTPIRGTLTEESSQTREAGSDLSSLPPSYMTNDPRQGKVVSYVEYPRESVKVLAADDERTEPDDGGGAFGGDPGAMLARMEAAAARAETALTRPNKSARRWKQCRRRPRGPRIVS
jgi:hypothetical protein